jgi:hypothetical protein
MHPAHPPLDELLSAWEEHSAPQRQQHIQRIVADLAPGRARLGGENHAAAAARLQAAVPGAVWPLLTTELVPACLDWLGEQLPPNTPSANDLAPELTLAAAALPVPALPPPIGDAAGNALVWLALAAAGGLAGALLIDWSRALLTALLTLAAAAWLLRRPATALPAPGGIAGRLLGQVLTRARAGLVRWLAASPSAAGQPVCTLADLNALVDRYYQAGAALVLLTCWARLTAPAAPANRDETAGLAPSTALFEAMGVLQRALVAGSDAPDDLRDAAEELAQAFARDGYTWEGIAPGTPYDDSLAARFRTFGAIEPGQPVKLLKSALCRDGTVLIRGTLKRS